MNGVRDKRKAFQEHKRKFLKSVGRDVVATIEKN